MNNDATNKKCPNCGAEIDENAKFCASCGAGADGSSVQNQPQQPASQPNIVVNVSNANTNTNANTNMGMYPFMRPKNKWVAFFLCLFLGFLGAHKFYENKGGMGILYIFTAGLFGIGWLIDCIVLLAKPNPYYVH